MTVESNSSAFTPDRKGAIPIGSVRVDLHKRERQYDNQFPMYTPQGVEVFLENFTYIKGRRLKGDLDASLLLLDFEQTLSEAPLSRREREVIYLHYELEYTESQVAKHFGVSKKAVQSYKKRAIHKIADLNAVKEGYQNVELDDVE